MNEILTPKEALCYTKSMKNRVCYPRCQDQWKNLEHAQGPRIWRSWGLLVILMDYQLSRDSARQHWEGRNIKSDLRLF